MKEMRKLSRIKWIFFHLLDTFRVFSQLCKVSLSSIEKWHFPKVFNFLCLQSGIYKWKLETQYNPLVWRSPLANWSLDARITCLPHSKHETFGVIYRMFQLTFFASMVFHAGVPKMAFIQRQRRRGYKSFRIGL